MTSFHLGYQLLYLKKSTRGEDFKSILWWFWLVFFFFNLWSLIEIMLQNPCLVFWQFKYMCTVCLYLESKYFLRKKWILFLIHSLLKCQNRRGHCWSKLVHKVELLLQIFLLRCCLSAHGTLNSSRIDARDHVPISTFYASRVPSL